jgi:hypothetical protein
VTPADLRDEFRRFERSLLIRWCVMLAVWDATLFAALHIWPPVWWVH